MNPEQTIDLKIAREIRREFDLFLSKQEKSLIQNMILLTGADQLFTGWAIIDFCFER